VTKYAYARVEYKPINVLSTYNLQSLNRSFDTIINRDRLREFKFFQVDEYNYEHRVH
jgi:hypothetical protein